MALVVREFVRTRAPLITLTPKAEEVGRALSAT